MAAKTGKIMVQGADGKIVTNLPGAQDASVGAARAGSLDADAAGLDAELKGLVDSAFEQPAVAVKPRYVLIVRDPDYPLDVSTFHGEGDVEVLEIDLGSQFDGTPDDYNTARGWLEDRLGDAGGIADAQARAAYLAAVRSAIEDVDDVDDLLAVLDYADTKPVRSAVASQVALWFDPQSIRDHFDGIEEGDDEWDENIGWIMSASDEQLASLADGIASNDSMYRAWHEAILLEAEYERSAPTGR